MKRLACILFVAAVAVQFSCKKKRNIAREGIINALTGKVTISIEGRNADARVGDVVREGTEIVTGADSFVEIYFSENAIKILENTEIKITALTMSPSGGTERSEFFIHKGRLFSKVSKKLVKGDSYTVKTPTTTAGIRGTEFLVSEEVGKGLVLCLSGKVEVEHAASPELGMVDLMELQEVVVEKDKKMTVKELSEENKRLLREIVVNFQDMKQDIRKKFEDQRQEIRDNLKKQRDENKEMIEKQKETDKANVEEQKETDKANIDAIKGTTIDSNEEAKKEVDKQKEETKKLLDSVKPDLDKLKSSIQ